MKIAVFDSGIGGMTVLDELRRRFPGQQYLYFGDTANVPYGPKSPSQIRSLCRIAAESMKIASPDAVVIACNTASSWAMDVFTEVFTDGVPVHGVVEAGVQSILSAAPERALILATRATIRSGIYRKLLQQQAPGLEVREQACPLLVPMIEEGWIRHPALELVLDEYLRPHRDSGPGVALLACTHYPWIREAFKRALPNWRIVDSATAVADGIQLLLKETTPGEAIPVEWRFTDPDAVPEFAHGMR